MQLKRSKRRTWEYVVLGLVIGLVMWTTVSLYAGRDRLFKERLLILELQTLRHLSIAYILEQKELPKSIENVLSPWSLVPGPWSKQDPFGHPYQYHPSSGWFTTTHPRYSHW